jgi:hypothetical protein
MSTANTAINCLAGKYTKLLESPTWGFVYIHSKVAVRIQWKRYSSGVPLYTEGSQSLVPGKNTVWTGGPSLYLRLDVNPSITTTLSWS